MIGAASTRSWLDGVYSVAWREIRDQMRDWRILAPILILTLFFPLLMNFTAQQAVDFVSRYGADIIGERLIPFLLMIVGFFPISVSLVIALESFAGERERRSLEPLLATPLRDSQLYFGKILASIVPPLSAAYLGIAVYLVGLAYQVGWTAPPTLLVQVLLLTTAQALVMVSGAVVISSQTTSVRAANLLSSFIIIPVAELIIGESMIMFWGRYYVLWWIVLALILLSLVLIRMGLHLFNREELLGREIDVLDLKWAWGCFWGSFRGQVDNLLEWYRRTLIELVPAMRGSLLLLAVAFAAAYVLGIHLASEFTLPGELLSLDALDQGAIEQLADYGLFSGRGFLWVVVNNTRAVLIASLFGAFSFGVLSTILLMAPIGIVGYLAGNLMLAGENAGLMFLGMVLPHGMVEIPAALVAGASILHLGLAGVSLPRGASLGESWLTALGRWARILLGIVFPLLLIAALLEVFLTPHIALLVLKGR